MKRRGRYVNPHLPNDKKNFWDFLRWKAGFYPSTDHLQSPPPQFSYPILPNPIDPAKPSATWIGHSTYLVEWDGVNFLTDPIFNQYCSPVPIKALKRKSKPAHDFHDLPTIDIVLISHNHYDHLDEKSVRRLVEIHPQILWLVPRGVSKWFHRRGITRTLELGWWDSLSLESCKVSAVPAQHFSGRSLWDKNKTHWNGYVVERGDKKFYFVGDTGYNHQDFKQIGFRFGAMDLSLIPIGSYAPLQFMAPVHCSPEEGVRIHQDVRSKLSLGMHWNTFGLSDEPQDRPPYDLYLAMKEKNLPFDTFIPIDIGVQVNW